MNRTSRCDVRMDVRQGLQVTRILQTFSSEPSRTRWPAAAGTNLLRTLGIEIVFGREARLGTRTIRITAKVRTNPITPSAPSANSATMDMGRV